MAVYTYFIKISHCLLISDMNMSQKYNSYRVKASTTHIFPHKNPYVKGGLLREMASCEGYIKDIIRDFFNYKKILLSNHGLIRRVAFAEGWTQIGGTLLTFLCYNYHYDSFTEIYITEVNVIP